MLTQALIIALAASVDAAYLRASDSRRLAGHGGHDDGDCHDDPEWRVGGVLALAARSWSSEEVRRGSAHLIGHHARAAGDEDSVAVGEEADAVALSVHVLARLLEPSVPQQLAA